ncbi:MAG TPA: hypothetical protein VFI76_02320 [Terrimicrobiaceae bacterium]|nr:hypothetical protein [Terrimicrobiaceae bacterium]
MPPGVDPGVASRLKSVSLSRNQSDVLRVRSVHEVLGDDAAAALTALSEAMELAGFRAGKAGSRPNGALTATFGKKGYGVIRVIARDGAGERPTGNDVTALLTVDFPVRQ